MCSHAEQESQTLDRRNPSLEMESPSGPSGQYNRNVGSLSAVSPQSDDRTAAKEIGYQPDLETDFSPHPSYDMVDQHVEMLLAWIGERRLRVLGLDRDDVHALVNIAAWRASKLGIEWGIPLEVLPELLQLGVYDIVLLVDNSGSMRLEEKGERLDDLTVISDFLAAVHELFELKTPNECDELRQQHSLRFCCTNGRDKMEEVRNRSEMKSLLALETFSGLTRLASGLEEKVLLSLLDKAKSSALHRPVVVVVVTDGEVSVEQATALSELLVGTYRTLEENYQSRNVAVEVLSFQFAQVGNGQGAQQFLSRLKLDTRLDRGIDCTPSKSALSHNHHKSPHRDSILWVG